MFKLTNSPHYAIIISLFFCVQVKADVQNVSGELIVSGLDSATSLIQAAKNLMNAVVVTVKSSYVASTKYPRQAIAEGIVPKQIVVWKMKVSFNQARHKV